MLLVPETVLGLVLGLLLYPVSTGSHHGSSPRYLQKRLEEVFRRFSPLVTSHATLEHGEDCISPYEEKLRQQIVEELHIIATSHATLGHVKDTIKKMEEFISMNDKELCNYRLALVCDPESRKCVCGPNRLNVTFVWENSQCHYAEGSMCSHNSKFECVSVTRCISMSTLEECTSGLCFCQREYNPTSQTSPKVTTEGILIEDFDDVDEDEEDEKFLSPKELDGREDDKDGESIAVKSTKESVVAKSSAEDDDDEDDEGEDGKEKIIAVNIDEVEKPAVDTGIALPPSPEEDAPESSPEVTTISTPVATSPVPTRRQELTSAIRRLEREVESIKSLSLGEECFSISEESNYAEYRRLVSNMDCVTGENDEENLTEILRKLELILESGSMMCNWTLHLQCNGQSKKCECRTSSEELDGFYLLFSAEGNRCVLVENSRCLSREHLTSRKSPFTDIPCNSEAKCIAEETKLECKSKIENCFCRKQAVYKPTTEPAPKQKKSRSRGGSKTSSASSLFHILTVSEFTFKTLITLGSACLFIFTVSMP